MDAISEASQTKRRPRGTPQAGSIIAEGYVHRDVFAAREGVSPRTVSRYCNEPDGLPHMLFGGRLYIPEDEGRAWIRNRVKRPNPSRRKAA